MNKVPVDREVFDALFTATVNPSAEWVAQFERMATSGQTWCYIDIDGDVEADLAELAAEAVVTEGKTFNAALRRLLGLPEPPPMEETK